MPGSKATIEQVKKYLMKNVVSAREGRKCVDGRYLPTQAAGMLARPGGDCGYVMALLAVSKKKNLGLTPEQCFNAIYKVVTDHEGKFCMHTDHQVDPDEYTHHGLIGCGHLAKAATDGLCQEYDVESNDVKRVIEYSRNLAEIEPALEIVNLDGDHEEKGVLVIKSREYTVNADDPELKQMYFIYDEARDNAFMQTLVDALMIDNVTYADMKQESDIQLKATLHNLAKRLPIYMVEFIDLEPHVVYVGQVE